jgi:hypothetical protein
MKIFFPRPALEASRYGRMFTEIVCASLPVSGLCALSAGITSNQNHEHSKTQMAVLRFQFIRWPGDIQTDQLPKQWHVLRDAFALAALPSFDYSAFI